MSTSTAATTYVLEWRDGKFWEVEYEVVNGEGTQIGIRGADNRTAEADWIHGTTTSARHTQAAEEAARDSKASHSSNAGDAPGWSLTSDAGRGSTSSGSSRRIDGQKRKK